MQDNIKNALFSVLNNEEDDRKIVERIRNILQIITVEKHRGAKTSKGIKSRVSAVSSFFKKQKRIYGTRFDNRYYCCIFDGDKVYFGNPYCLIEIDSCSELGISLQEFSYDNEEYKYDGYIGAIHKLFKENFEETERPLSVEVEYPFVKSALEMRGDKSNTAHFIVEVLGARFAKIRDLNADNLDLIMKVTGQDSITLNMTEEFYGNITCEGYDEKVGNFRCLFTYIMRKQDTEEMKKLQEWREGIKPKKKLIIPKRMRKKVGSNANKPVPCDEEEIPF